MKGSDAIVLRLILAVLIGITYAAVYICGALSSIKEDANTVAESVPAIQEDIESAQDGLDILSDKVDTTKETVRDLWAQPFCYSLTEDSVMMGCVYEDGAWYRKNNGDGYGVDAAA